MDKSKLKKPNYRRISDLLDKAVRYLMAPHFEGEEKSFLLAFKECAWALDEFERGPDLEEDFPVESLNGVKFALNWKGSTLGDLYLADQIRSLGMIERNEFSSSLYTLAYCCREYARTVKR